MEGQSNVNEREATANNPFDDLDAEWDLESLSPIRNAADPEKRKIKVRNPQNRDEKWQKFVTDILNLQNRFDQMKAAAEGDISNNEEARSI